MGTPGCPDIEAILADLINESDSVFKGSVHRDREKITLKTVLKFADRLKAFEDFSEALKDAIRPLENNPQPAFRAGMNRAAE